MTTTILVQNLPGRPGLLPASIVLRDLGETAAHRYATHMRIETPVEGEPHSFRHSFEHGHYFADLREAMEDYIDRCAERVTLAMRQAYDLSPRPVTPAMITLPLATVQAAYGLLDDAESLLTDNDYQADMVHGAVDGLRVALTGEDAAGYRAVQEALNAAQAAGKTVREEQEATA